MTDRPEVTVVIPVRDDPLLPRAVDAVLAQEDAPAFEVIVVDNGSSAGFRKQIDALPGGVRVLDEPQRGAGAARNRAVDAVRGGLIFFTDADAVVAKDWIREGLAGFAATGADLLQGSWKERGPTPAERLAAGLSSRLQAAPLHPGTCDTKNLAVRREVFERVRFDPEFLRDQDTVFGIEAVAAGFRIARWDAMTVEHEPYAHLHTLIARTACGAWSWRKASLRLTGRRRTRRRPWRLGPLRLGRPPRQWEARASVLAAFWSARALEAVAVGLPGRVALAWLVGLHRLASWGGASAFEAGLRQARVEEVERAGWWPGRAHQGTPPNRPAM